MKTDKQQIAVIFEVYPDAKGQKEYLEIAAGLREKLKDIDGFISIERFQSLNDPEKMLSLSFWESEEAIEKWRNQMEHRKGQKAGHDDLFKSYRIRVAGVMRDYTNEDRKHAPSDSNKSIIGE
ncbi:antibiotic biosynthesis monooxygenase [Puteibacter caeruleilacunae]|nr:antibiotic biosynthesis monooxygenase [Puteibacter caeruleilacunae]